MKYVAVLHIIKKKNEIYVIHSKKKRSLYKYFFLFFES